MPPIQRGHVRRLRSGKVQLRYYDRDGVRRTGGVLPTRSAAFAHYRDVIEPSLRGVAAPMPELTFAEFVDLFLKRHTAQQNTIKTLRHRLSRPQKLYGDTTLRELERMSGDLADFRASLPPRYGCAVMSALRHVLERGVRWGYLGANRAKEAGPKPAAARTRGRDVHARRGRRDRG